eukprot:308501_1
MHIRSIFIWPIISFICTSFGSDVSNEVTQFGFKTAVADGSYTPATILITLWFGSTIYQGSTSAPDGQNIWYTLTMQNKPYFSVIERNCSKITQAKIMFELDATDAVGIDQVRVETQSGDWYGINKHYRESSLDDVIWIDNEAWHHAPYKQIVYFDTTRPNVFIDDAAWSDGTNVYSRSPSNTHQCSRLSTPIYGGDGGEFYSVLNQGRVYAMLDWGLASNKYLQIRGWKSDWQMADTIYGTGTERSLCTPFSLSSDDYITGYHIWFDSHGISGVQFLTRNGLTLSCIGLDDSTTTSYSNNYLYGPFNFSYLTGWNVWSGSMIDQIQFQFADSLLTASPTQIPSAHSVPPSAIPTIPSRNPTNNPSHTPSSRPTYNPSHPTGNPSTNPMYNITPSHVMGTERTAEIVSSQPKNNITPSHVMGTERTAESVSSQPKNNQYLIDVLSVIISTLALCSVCAAIALCVCINKDKNQKTVKRLISGVNVSQAIEVDDDMDECEVKEEIQGVKNKNQIDVRLQFKETPNLKGEGTAINPGLVMAGSAIMTKGKSKLELEENARRIDPTTGSKSGHTVINAGLVMSGSAIKTKGKTKLELAVAENAKRNDHMTGSKSEHTTINSGLVMSGSAIKTKRNNKVDS